MEKRKLNFCKIFVEISDNRLHLRKHPFTEGDKYFDTSRVAQAAHLNHSIYSVLVFKLKKKSCKMILQWNFAMRFWNAISKHFLQYNFAMQFCNAILQCNFAMQFYMQFQSTFCNAIFQCNFPMQFSNAIFQCNFPMQFCKTYFEILQNLLWPP